MNFPEAPMVVGYEMKVRFNQLHEKYQILVRNMKHSSFMFRFVTSENLIDTAFDLVKKMDDYHTKKDERKRDKILKKIKTNPSSIAVQ